MITGKSITGRLFPRQTLRKLAQSVYSYHNLGTGNFPEGEEKTPHGAGERYNFDRMYMMVSTFDFTDKAVVDLGCNSGWFCVQAKLLGSGVTVGIDSTKKGIMGQGLRYALQFERAFRLGIDFVDRDLNSVDFLGLAERKGLKQFDVALVLSVLHHIGNKNMEERKTLFKRLYDAVSDIVFYEDHEFWNDLTDEEELPIALRGEGYRYGWNEDLSWQRKIHSIEAYESKILDFFRTTWRREVLMMDAFAEIRFLGFSEKRRPVLAFFKETAESGQQDPQKGIPAPC